MIERLNSLLKYLKLTSSQFADEIGVQRSSVSHVMGGRNKPGFDFIRKILSRFPEISADWLITGDGEMLRGKSKTEYEMFESEEERREEPEKEHKVREKAMNKGILKDSENETGEENKKQQIERIIIIYKDKSFEEYNPA